MIRLLVTAVLFSSLKWHYEVFRWFDMFAGKGSVEAEVLKN
jgi:16S rRNA G966 N2-methylase RsmD